MPETTKRTSPRKGSSASSSNARSAGKGAPRSRSSASQNGGKPSAKKQAASSSQGKTSRARAGSTNGKQNGAEKVKDPGAGAVLRDAGTAALKTVAVPLATGAAGVIGGVLLDRVGFKRCRKVLGIPLPGQRTGLDGVAKQIGEAGKQLGKFASEIRATREKAGEISKVLS